MPETTTALTFASALSDANDTAAAMDEAIEQLNRRLAGPVDLAMVFATPHHAHGMGLVHELLRTTLAPRIEMGVTCEGVIGVRKEIERQPGLSIVAASLPRAVIEPFQSGEIDWSAALDDPISLRRQLWPHDDAEPKAVLFLADPFSTAMLSVLPAIESALPDCPIIGGMASGASRSGDNRLLYDGQVLTEGAVGAVVGGDVQIDCTVSQGCRPVGKPYVITKSQRHIVMELTRITPTSPSPTRRSASARRSSSTSATSAPRRKTSPCCWKCKPCTARPPAPFYSPATAADQDCSTTPTRMRTWSPTRWATRRSPASSPPAKSAPSVGRISCTGTRRVWSSSATRETQIAGLCEPGPT